MAWEDQKVTKGSIWRHGKFACFEFLIRASSKSFGFALMPDTTRSERERIEEFALKILYNDP